MKNTDEMVKSLFSRRDDYIKEQKRKQKLYAKIGMSAGVLVLAAAVGFFALPRKNAVIEQSDNIQSETNYSVSNGDNNTANMPCITIPMKSSVVNATVMLYGKHVTEQLKNNYEKAKDTDVFGVLCRPPTDMSFKVNGKTLKELSDAVDDERLLTEKLYDLLKKGDDLKYGEKLCTVGTPDGIRWDRTLYEDTVAYFGEEVLDKYIVGGEFLKDRLEADIKDVKKCAAEKAYKSARFQYLCRLAENTPGEGESYAVGEDSDCICVFFSKVSFREFSPDGVENWYFDNIIPDGVSEEARAAELPQSAGVPQSQDYIPVWN